MLSTSSTSQKEKEHPHSHAHHHEGNDAVAAACCSSSHDDEAVHPSSNKANNPTRKAILTKEDLQDFQESSAYLKFMDFIVLLNDSIKNKKLGGKRNKDSMSLSNLEKATASASIQETDKVEQTTTRADKVIDLLCNLLKLLSVWIDEIPPEQIGLSRFGNPSFKKWYDRLQERMNDVLEPLFANLQEEPVVIEAKKLEAATYLLASFGDRKRVDYGTGHEASFICFMLCIWEWNVVDKTANLEESLISVVFWDYIQVMRKLQFVYWLEPAGSHGVWGLDDYHFLPFLFGSSQLMDHKHLKPKSIHDKEIVEELHKDYMYFSCIHHINSIKSDSLRWHSPMLDDISGVKKWSKVNEGMFKMYKQEVLNKLPIMQHFLFGSVLPFDGSAEKIRQMSGEMEHVHAFGQEHPLCCTIRVPSSIAAVNNNPRMMPFD